MDQYFSTLVPFWKRCCVFFLLLLPLSMLTACGASPSSFVFADNSGLTFISWHENNGQLSGQYIRLTKSSFGGGPSTQNIGFTGEKQDQQITLHLSFLTVTGEIKDNTLQLSSVNGSGQASRDIGYAASEDDYNKLVPVFNASSSLQQTIDTLNQDLQYNTLQAKAYDDSVSKMQSQYDATKKDTDQLSNDSYCYQIDLIAYETEPQDSTFKLDDPDQSQLAKDFRQAQTQWQKLQSISIPTISGLSLPWLISKDQYQQVTSPADQALKQARHAYQQDQPKMDTLQKQFKDLDQKVQQVKQQKGCS